MVAISKADQDTGASAAPAGRISTYICAGWGLGAIIMGLIANVFNVMILPFATERLGIAAGVAGAVLAVSKIYDAFVDPLVGTFSDNLQTPIGRRRPVLMVAAGLCAAAVLFLFFAPDWEGSLIVGYYVVGAIGLSTAYAAWTVPYLAMSAEMTDDYHERSRLISYRIYGGALGLVIGSLCGPTILGHLGGDRHAYRVMAMVTAAVILVISFVFIRMTRGARFLQRTEVQSFSLIRQARLVASSKPIALLVTAKGWWYLNVAASQASLVYVLKYIAQKPPGWLTYYFMAFTVGMIGAQPLWLMLAKRFDKKLTFVAATLLYGLVVLSWYICNPAEPLAIFAARAALIGASSGGTIMLLLSMYNDAIDADYLQSGVRREGAFAGVYALVEKLFTALGVAGAGALMGAMGYVSSKTGGHAQPASALSGMLIASAIIPCAGALAVVLTISFYKLKPRGGVVSAGVEPGEVPSL